MKASKLKNFKEKISGKKVSSKVENIFSRFAGELGAEQFTMGLYVAARQLPAGKGLNIVTHTEKLTDGTFVFLSRQMFATALARLMENSKKNREVSAALLMAMSSFNKLNVDLEAHLAKIAKDKMEK